MFLFLKKPEKIKRRVRKPRELAVLQKIAAWREREAEQYNLPRGG